jgi:hypothetical protein
MLLRLNSQSENVKVLQTFLNSTGYVIAKTGLNSPGHETGRFDAATETAVKKWQKDNGLKADGIVGPVTWGAMAIASTDQTELINVDEITIKENFLPRGEYAAGPTKKEWLFLHHTAGWENPYNVISSWGRDKRGIVGTEFVIGGPHPVSGDSRYDGEILQAIPTGGYGWHLGTGNSLMHRNSIGIEVCNFGYLTKGGFNRNVNGKRTWVARNSRLFYTYVGTEVHEKQVIKLDKPFRGYEYWHKYSSKQISSLKDLILFIANRDKIDVKKGLPELIRKRGVDAFNVCNVEMCTKTKGLWNHTNVQTGKFDMYPDPALIDMLLNL